MQLDQLKSDHGFIYGHIARSTNAIEKLIIQGNSNGRIERGKSSIPLIDQMKLTLELIIHEITQLAQNKEG